MKNLIIMGIATLLCSCSVYKTYQRPVDIKTASAYRDVQIEDTATIGAVKWRELFTDNRLCSLIEQGLQHNTGLQIAHLRIEQNEATLQSARLAYLPSLNLSGDGSISSFDGSKPNPAYTIAAKASWEIDIFGKLTAAKESAKSAVESSKAYEQAVRTNLISTIANSYYTLLMLDCQLNISMATIQTWEANIKTLELLKQAGASNDAAILRSKANRLALESSALKLRQGISETENSLSTLLGQEPQAITRGVLEEQRFPETIAVGVPVQLLSNRPDVRQAEYNLAQAFYATNVARAAFYPNLNIGGTAGWTNSVGTAIVNPGGLLLSTAGSLLQPVFNKGKNTANLKIAKSQQEEAKLRFSQIILDAGKEVSDALVKWQMATQRIGLGEQQITALQEALRKTELLMKHSSVNYLEVLTAQQSLLSAELIQSQCSFDKIQGVINLYHTLGGGVE